MVSSMFITCKESFDVRYHFMPYLVPKISQKGVFCYSSIQQISHVHKELRDHAQFLEYFLPILVLSTSIDFV